MKSVVVYLGGKGPTNVNIPGEAVVSIAADSGADLALSHNVFPDFIVGDLDSISDQSLAIAKEHGCVIERFPQEKDETDFEIALHKAKEFDADELVVVGGGGQRTDHLVANMSVLGGSLTDSWITTAHFDTCTVYICRPDQPRTLEVSVGQQLSLVPLHGNAIDVTTQGLKWELSNSTLESHRARGISNECVNEHVTVAVKKGTVAIITSS
jgi:thiamine pyrophosphokinase